MRDEYEEPKIHSGHMEVAISSLINYRVHVIVPNVSHGLGLSHECDMLVLDDKNRLTEIEIKVSLSDLKADFKKKHGHQSRIISRLIYAVPEKLVAKATELCPKEAGIISVVWRKELGWHTAAWVRYCKHSKMAPVDWMTIRNLLRLGCMRIWSLKRVLNQRQLKKIVTPMLHVER